MICEHPHKPNMWFKKPVQEKMTLEERILHVPKNVTLPHPLPWPAPFPPVRVIMEDITPDKAYARSQALERAREAREEEARKKREKREEEEWLAQESLIRAGLVERFLPRLCHPGEAFPIDIYCDPACRHGIGLQTTPSRLERVLQTLLKELNTVDAVPEYMYYVSGRVEEGECAGVSVDVRKCEVIFEHVEDASDAKVVPRTFKLSGI